MQVIFNSQKVSPCYPNLLLHHGSTQYTILLIINLTTKNNQQTYIPIRNLLQLHSPIKFTFQTLNPVAIFLLRVTQDCVHRRPTYIAMHTPRGSIQCLRQSPVYQPDSPVLPLRGSRYCNTICKAWLNLDHVRIQPLSD